MPADTFYLEKRIRSFAYLSGAKLEPLYGQIKEPIRQRLALSLGISVPVLPVAPQLRADLRPPTTNEVGMLSVVLARLDEEGQIGTVDEPGRYFAGQLELRWGSAYEFIFLSGSTQRTMVVLTGSNRHLIEHFESDLPTVSWPASSAVGFDRILRRIFAGEEEQDDEASVRVTRLALAQRSGPQEVLEFVARRITHDDGFIGTNWRVPPDFEHLVEGGDFKVLHGSPLYLAYAE